MNETKMLPSHFSANLKKTRGLSRFGAALVLGLLSTSLVSCRPSRGAETPAMEVLRKDAEKSKDPELVARWLEGELLAPGGKRSEAQRARQRLDELGAKGLVPDLLRALDDRSHGHPKAAAEHYVSALLAARESNDPRAQLLAWFAAQQAYELAGHARDFGKKHHGEFASLLDRPGNIGFRAYGTVVDLWLLDDERSDGDIAKVLVDKLGCAAGVRLAGPFGSGADAEVLRSFPAENPGVWPMRFPETVGRTEVPRILATEVMGCDAGVDEPVGNGLFYSESFLTLPEADDLIVTTAGALQVWVDDHLVLERNPRTWGIWPKFGFAVRLGAGRHRIVAKLTDTNTSVRVMHRDGRPYALSSDTDAGLGYSLAKPEVLPDPNELMRYLAGGAVSAPKEPLGMFVAAHLFDFEGQSDVATVLFENLVKEPSEATGLALLAASGFVRRDPIYDEAQIRDLVHELEQRAVEKDPGLWAPRLELVLWEAEQKGAVTAVDPLVALVKEFPEVPGVYYTLARLYDDLGWGPEWEEVVRGVALEYPDDPEAISLAIEQYETQGDLKKVDALLARLVELDPDTNVLLSRALSRQDFPGAIAELRRLSARRPDRKDLVDRLEEVLVRSGQGERALGRLEKAVEKEAKDVHARLALADARLAKGEHGALAEALVRAVEAGGDASVIEEAIDLIAGMTALEPYRLDARKVITEYEARQANAKPGEGAAGGTSARVLDYGALLVRSDGSSRFLEHEVIHVQSEEGIRQFAEMNAGGNVLHLRVLKKDGRIFEPEEVAGKPTVTMPHLEIGDYVELERIVSEYGNGGEIWAGPTWYFREENITYERSEFLVVAPREKKLIIETTEGVPNPVVTEDGAFVARRYRVDQSPAAPSEPNSPPASEFLPRISVGWGIQLEHRLRDLAQSFISLEAKDPRIVRIAENIVKGVPKEQTIERARALYHWVLESVQEGEGTDGRRVVVSRNGSRWRGFETLCRALDIPVRWAVAESKVASPIRGELSSADRPLFPLLRVGEGDSAQWLTIEDRYAPFGTVPSTLRGERAYLLGRVEPEVVTVPAGGAPDGISYEGRGQISADGSARLTFSIRFLGQFATGLRNGLSQIPENQLASIIESRLLGQSLQGARLIAHEVKDQDQLDRPLTLAVTVEVPQFATPTGSELLIGPPFMPRLSQLTALSTRVTPLLLTEATIQTVDLELGLPEGYSAFVSASKGSSPGGAFEVGDTAQAGSLRLFRKVETKTGRIAPEAYLGFQSFTREADSSLSRAIRIAKTP